MSIEPFVQIAGGLFGVAVAYAMHRIVEIPHERSTAKAQAEYQKEIEEIRKKKQSLKSSLTKL